MARTISVETMIDPTAFDTYIQLRSIAEKYHVEDKLEIPQLVIVGETSTGKSMLVQNFLRFPCSFSQANVATRCPVAYRLIYKPDLPDGRVHVKQPADCEVTQLGDYLRQLMEQIEQTGNGFREKPELIEIESASYTDFEIIDVPGFVSGEKNSDHRTAVETIVEQFVRDPRFSIVLLKEATQIGVNSTATQRVHHLCTTLTPIKSILPPRPDYHDHMITIQTKFDTFMLHNTTAQAANEMIALQLKEFGESYFVNMIFGGYSMPTRSFDENVAYITNLPQLEKEHVDRWVNDINQYTEPGTDQQRFNPEYRERIGIEVVRKQIQDLWLRVRITL